MGSAILLNIARWLFLLYVASLPLVHPFSQRFYGYLFVYSDLLFAASAGACLLSAISGKIQLRKHRVFIWVGAFLLAMTLAAATSEEPTRSFFKLGGVVYLGAAGWLAFNLAEDTRFIKLIIFAWLAGTAVTVLGAFLGVTGYYAGFDTTSTNKFLFHFGSLPTGNYPRVDSFFDNANMMANYLNVSVVVTLAAGAAGWISQKSAFAFVLLIIGASIFTFSAGIGGIILSVAIFLALGSFRQQRSKRTAVLLGGVFVAILAFASTLISPVQRDSHPKVSIPLLNVQFEPSVRVVVWANALQRGSEFPLLGRGTGTDAANVRYQVVSGQTQVLRDAHQAWLNVFGQAGLVGVAAFTLLCLGVLRSCKFDPGFGTQTEWVRFGLSTGFVGAFLFQNLFGSFEDARHLWVLIGLLPAAQALVGTNQIQD